MHVVTGQNVNEVYRLGLSLLDTAGEIVPSRNGRVLRVANPVTTVYQCPTERVLFDEQRDANPFFHLFESLWMLAGRNDVRTLDRILPTFKQFSDDGVTFHGAYGYRWRHWPVPTTTYTKELDQLAIAVRMLRENPSSRRVVISMWDPVRDLDATGLDIPCNDLIKVAIVTGKLDLTVFNRSNDAIYGCYGANAVHMSVLQEYLAAMIGVPVGRYVQISTDFHAYLDTPYRWESYWPLAVKTAQWTDPYARPSITGRAIAPFPLVTAPRSFDRELAQVIDTLRDRQSLASLEASAFENAFFPRVAIPMHRAFELHKQKHDGPAIDLLHAAQEIGSSDVDWLTAGRQWLTRRWRKRTALQEQFR